MAQRAPGVSSSERQSGARTIPGLPSAVGGMVGVTYIGPGNKAIQIGSLSQFERIFGPAIPESFMYEQVKGFFDNGGSELWITRALVNAGTNTAASATMNDGAAASALIATAVGPGVGYNALKVLTAKEDIVVGVAGSALATQIASGAVTSVALLGPTAAKIDVGDTVVFKDGANTVRFVVGQKLGNTILPAAAASATGVISTSAGSCTLETFSVAVQENGVNIYGPVGGLRMSSLSNKNFALGRLNDVNNPELKVSFTLGVSTVATNNDNRPANVAGGTSLSGGVATMTGHLDTDFIGSTSNGYGLNAFNKVRRVRALAIPGVTGTASAVSKALLEYCGARQDCVAVLEGAQNVATATLVAARTNEIGGNSFGYLVDTWIEITSPRTGLRVAVPAAGYILGAWARTDRSRNVSKAPAGQTDGLLVGALDVLTKRPEEDRDTLFDANINEIQFVPNVGVCLMGARTLQKGGDFEGLNVRRAFIYFRTSLDEGMGPELFETNDAEGRAKLVRTAEAFLSSEWKSRKTLVGETQDEAFTITCNTTNNPPEIVRARKKKVNFSLNIPDTTERIEMEFERSLS